MEQMTSDALTEHRQIGKFSVKKPDEKNYRKTFPVFSKINLVEKSGPKKKFRKDPENFRARKKQRSKKHHEK
jgi:hypothetical protein